MSAYDDEMWLAPQYFKAFSCKCGSCRNACCKGWKIAVTREEYFRLLGLSCSENLHYKIEGAFGEPEFPTDKKFRYIESDWRGQCRMLDEDGLCMIQRECGERMIPETCRVYPRCYKRTNGVLRAVCSSSCEAVAEMLMTGEKLVFGELALPGRIKPEISEELPKDSDPLLTESVRLLQDRSRDLSVRIFNVGELLHFSGDTDVTFERLLGVLECLIETSGTLNDYASEVFNRYREKNEAGENLFKTDFWEFERDYPEWSSFFENIIVNSIFYSSFPYCDKRIEADEALWGLLMQYKLLKLICTACTRDEPSLEKFADSVAAVYHLVEHTSFYYNAFRLLSE